MSYSAMELKAERSILRTLGLPAVFTSYSGETTSLYVLPEDAHSALSSKGFQTREVDKKFEALKADIPLDFRDGTLEVEGTLYNVLDVAFDEYQIRAKVTVE